MQRLHSLDYLRGLMALAVMMFHYVSWSLYDPLPDSLLGKLGIYAVSIFYILSGLSLSYIYLSIGKNFSLREFLIKRVFRIAPIFWCCLVVVLLLRFIQEAVLNGEMYRPDFYEVILNFTLLFGFIMPDRYFSVGAWSIGNEVVFYSIFPFVIFSCLRYGRPTALLWLVISCVLGYYFSVIRMDEDNSLVNNWAVYVNPFNQLFLFLAGICISIFFKPLDTKSSKNIALLLSLMILLLIFAFIPVGNENIDLVTGYGRLYMSLLSILIVLNVYLFQVEIGGAPGRMLLFLGKCCYSIYLIHPIVALPLAFLLHDKLGVNLIFVYAISAILTFILSAFVYEKIEKPMMSLGKKLADQYKKGNAKARSELLEDIK